MPQEVPLGSKPKFAYMFKLGGITKSRANSHEMLDRIRLCDRLRGGEIKPGINATVQTLLLISKPDVRKKISKIIRKRLKITSMPQRRLTIAKSLHPVSPYIQLQ